MEDIREQIRRAVLAHGRWKDELLAAIRSGNCALKATELRRDDLCDFGIWLYGLPREVRESKRIERIRKLHAAFHDRAAKVLYMAQSGEKLKGMDALESSESYALAGRELIEAMREWERSLLRMEEASVNPPESE